MTELNKDNFNEFIKEGKTIVDLWAPWCGPCRMLGPVLEEVEEETGIKLGKVNVDDNEEIAQKFNCQSIPMVLVFENGELKTSFVGYAPKEKVLDLIK